MNQTGLDKVRGDCLAVDIYRARPEEPLKMLAYSMLSLDLAARVLQDYGTVASPNFANLLIAELSPDVLDETVEQPTQ